MPLRIRPASSRDAAAIVRLFRKEFPPKLLALTIYGCRGIRAYVEKQIAVPCHSSDTVYLVAAEEGRARGCAELRRGSDALFLSYLAVARQARRHGVGTKLVSAAARLASPETVSMALDVLETNRLARSWYRRLGFREVGHTDFAFLDGAADAGNGFAVLGYPQALATYKQFGFSEFRIRTERGEFSAGMLGPRYFRVRGESLGDEPRLPSILRQLDPRRRILTLSARSSARKVLRLLRMTVPLRDLRCCES